MSLLSFSLGLLLLTSPSSHAKWELNDVSFVLPLTASRPIEHSIFGEEPPISRPILEQLLLFVPTTDRVGIQSMQSEWGLIALRIDHCFREHLPDPCQKQVRASWQPVYRDAGNSLSTRKAALHAFYPVSDEEWPNLIADLKSLKQIGQTDSSPLQIHPAFRRTTTAQPFTNSFYSKLSKWIRSSRMSTLAVSLPVENHTKTIFRRFNVWPKAKIPLQELWLSYSTEMEIRYGNSSSRHFIETLPHVLQTAKHMDDLRPLLKDSRTFFSNRTALIEFGKIERRATDPTQHAPLTIDCLSCHATGSVRTWLLSRPELSAEDRKQIDSAWKGPQTEQTYDLTNTSVRRDDLSRMRALGYEGREFHVLDRVIHETAGVADELNRIYPFR